MKLQILIPHYRETADEVRPLLDSIALQQCIDFREVGVIIVHDGPDAAPLDDLPGYPFAVEQFAAPKGGVSAARNAALDRATADYVMFCDADDMFFNSCGLYIVFREIAGGGFDYLVSSFVEESRDPKHKADPVFITHDMDFTFVHGKVVNRRFLIDNGIRWNDALTIHEDSYFNCLCARLAVNAKHCQTAFYLWRWRDASVCRHDPKYMLKTYRNMLESSTALVRELVRRGKTDAAAEVVVQLTYDTYFTFNKREWMDQANREYRDATERRFAAYHREFDALYRTVPEEKRAQILVGIRNRMFGEGVMFEQITFSDWMRKVEAIDVESKTA